MSVKVPLSMQGRLSVGSGEILCAGNSVVEGVLPWALSLGVLLVYLSFPTKNYYWDGIDFALVIEGSQGLSRALIHPHHLLYNVFGFVIYHSLNVAGWHIRAVHALQMTNAVLSALCARLLFRFLRQALSSVSLSSVLTLLFSFSATWWKYSTDADAYVPSMLCLFVCLNLALAAPKLRPWAIAAAHAAAMWMHQLAIFFYPVIVLCIFMRSEGLSFRRRLMLVLKYSAAASVVTLGANYYCFHLQTGGYGLAAFADWLTSYLHGQQGYSFSFNLYENLFYTLRGHARLFFEGRLNWLEGLMSAPVAALIAVLIALVITLLWKFFSGLRSLKLSAKALAREDDGRQRAAAAGALWAGVYLAFLFFWYPYFTPYRLFYLPALVILCGVVMARFEIARLPARMRFAAMLVAAMALSNFLFFIYPLSHEEKNAPLMMALRMTETWRGGTVIYYASSNADNRLFEYFNPATTWRKFGPAGDAAIEDEIREIYGQGGAAWMDASALDEMRSSPEGARWLAQHTSQERRAELVNHAYRIIFVQIIPAGGTLTAVPTGP